MASKDDEFVTTAPPSAVAIPVDTDITVDDRASRDEFSAVVREHHESLGRLAYLLCSDRQQAEDAVAEAYAKVWRRFRAGTVDNLVPYLRQAVVNEVRGGLRRRLVERREAERRRDDLATHDRDITDRGALWPAVKSLGIKYRTVIVLRFYEDLSEQQTAKLLGVKVGTVKSRTNRAMAQLRALIGDPDAS